MIYLNLNQKSILFLLRLESCDLKSLDESELNCFSDFKSSFYLFPTFHSAQLKNTEQTNFRFFAMWFCVVASLGERKLCCATSVRLSRDVLLKHLLISRKVAPELVAKSLQLCLANSLMQGLQYISIFLNNENNDTYILKFNIKVLIFSGLCSARTFCCWISFRKDLINFYVPEWNTKHFRL